MKAMIWKELRENAPWAVLICASWCIFNFFGYNMMFSANGVIRDPLQSWDGKVILNAMVAALGGGLLGAVQILPELRRDQWAFLLHRPASASSLFAGKAVAGVLMLFTIISIPETMVFYLLRFRQGLEIVSFWYLAISIGIAFVIALIVYFSAVIAALRPTRVFGSRLLSLATAILIVVVLFVIPTYWQALLFAVVCLVVLVLAARGCFEAKGEYRRMATAGRVALGITLFVGGSALGMGVTAFLVSFIPKEHWLLYLSDNDPDAYNRGELYDIYDQFHSVEYYRNSVAVLPVRDAFLLMLKNTREVSEMGSIAVVSKPVYLNIGRYIKWNTSGEIVTYYDTVGKRLVFYSTKTHRIIGYSGPLGYYDVNHVPRDGSASFSGELLGHLGHRYLYGSDAVYKTDESGRFIRRIITTEANRPFQNVVALGIGKAQRFWVLKRDVVEQYDADGKRLLSVPLGSGAEASQYIGLVTSYRDERFLWIAEIHKKWPGTHSLHLKILEISETGELQATTKAPYYDREGEAVVPAAMLLSGAVLPVLRNDTHILSSRSWATIDQLYGIFYRSSGFRVSFASVVWALGLSAAVGWFLARRARLRPALCWMWAGLTLLFGAVALIGLLAIYPWPLRLACGQCKKLRSIESQDCPHCNARWPKPGRDGTEIVSREFESRALVAGGQE